MLRMPDPAELTAIDAAERLARDELRAPEYAEACWRRLEARESEIRAWRFVDRDLVMKQAEAAEAHRRAGGLAARPAWPRHRGRSAR